MTHRPTTRHQALRRCWPFRTAAMLQVAGRCCCMGWSPLALPRSEGFFPLFHHLREYSISLYLDPLT